MLSFQQNSRWWEVRYLEMWCLQPAGFVRRWLVDMKFGPFCFGWWHLEKTKFANTSFSGFLSSGGDGGRRRLVGCVRRKFAWIRRADLVLVARTVDPGCTTGRTDIGPYLPVLLRYALKRLFWDAPPALVRWSDRFLNDSIALIPSMSCNWKPHSNFIPQTSNRSHDQM